MIITHTAHNTRNYEVVEKIPTGFFVWNIGRNAPAGYIAIAEQGDEENTINPDTLKAIKLNDDEITKIDNAASYGITTLEKAKKAIASKRIGKMADRKRVLALAVIEIFERIS